MASSSSRKLTKNVSFGPTSLGKEMEGLSVSKRLVRTLSEKIKGRSSSSKCLSLYTKGGGCSRVSSCEEIDISNTRRLGITEKKNSRKTKAADRCPSLPDDVWESVLVRLPLSSLVAARLVCKKWSHMITTPQFMRLRIEGFHRSLWLFLFDVSRRDGFHVGEIRALDVASDWWHRIHIENLAGRFSFSVTSIGLDVYIVGGCSSDPIERGTVKALNEVLAFSPLTGSCRKVSSMKVSRSGAVLGVFEVSAICSIFRSSQCKRQSQGQVRFKTRIGGVSDVYEDPHRFSLRRQFRDAFKETSNMSDPTNLVGHGRNNQPNFSLVVVGGRGSWDEPLDSGEVYDPVTDNWTEIARLPRDFGAASAGAVCQGKFYVYSEAGKLAVFDLDGGFWILIQTFLPPRLREFCPKLVSCRSRLFMCCVCWSERDGQVNRREKAVREIWELDIATATWGAVSRHPDAPMDCNAAFVADEDRIYGFEMFRIFGQVLDFVTACHVTRMKWSRVSRKHGGHAADASSCSMKSMVVLNV